jgi:hypothetical protein
MNNIENKLIEGTATIEITGNGTNFYLHIEGSYFGEFFTYTDAADHVVTLINGLM